MDREVEQVETVDTVAETTTGAKEECLAKHFQWDDTTGKCEKATPEAACLHAGNQWNNREERCDYTKENCLAAGNQWNDEREACEYTKEQCLAMNAQWDEQDALCEVLPVTTEQKVEECLNDGGQRDYAEGVCEQETSANQ